MATPNPQSVQTDSAWATILGAAVTAASVIVGASIALFRHMVGVIVAPIKSDVEALKLQRIADKAEFDAHVKTTAYELQASKVEMRESVARLSDSISEVKGDVKEINGKLSIVVEHILK